MSPTPLPRAGSVVMEGERVRLRFPSERDADEMVALRKRSLKRLRAWDPKPPKGASLWRRDWFDRLLASRRDPAYRKLIVCRVDDAAIIGGTSLNSIIRGPFNSAFAGWWLGDPFEGHGYMSEALGLLLRYAFTEVRLHRVEANIRPENVRSIRVAKRVGFRREGYSPRYLQIAGEWADHERYAVIAEEWKAAERGRRTGTSRNSGRA
jgi:ribosomal-protein-alanine N-acetyltransferase